MLGAFTAWAQVIPDLYIVELKSEPAVAAAAKTQRRAAILSEQAVVREAARAAGGEVISAVQTVANALVVRIPDARAGELGRLPGVTRVYPVLEARLELDQALPLHRVPEAWAQAGGMDRAGAGVKIGLIDTGIDPTHPGFDDSSLVAPEGYPKTGSTSDERALNSKIIVVRDYQTQITPTAVADPRDHIGHGTATAMVAAGMPAAGPFGAIVGAAPKAFIGVYKVFAGAGGSSRSDVVLKAVDDAVADGMDIINISMGVEPAPRPEDDILVAAVERAAAAGVLVTKSAGNSGPTPNTLTSPASAPSGITVGANWNQRDFANPAAVVGDKSYDAIPGNGPNSKDPIEAPLFDVAALDNTGQACGPLAENSLTGRIAFILRGPAQCYFETKLTNAQNAGAVAALVYSDADRPDAAPMGVGAATLPAAMVSNADGLLIKQRLAENPALTARLRFQLEPVTADPLRMAAFSSRGPSPDYTVKPDLVAAGVNISTAAQSLDQEGDIYSSSGFGVLDGTSFSAPLVAGAAAVLKSARPGLTAAQYRSLLINSAAPLNADPAGQNPAQVAGAGMLNLDAALRSTVAVQPVSINYGIGGAITTRERTLSITNLDQAADELTITVEPNRAGPQPALSRNQLSLAPGASDKITVAFNAAALDPGECQGILRIRSSRSGVETRVPYWYGVMSGEPRFIHTVWISPYLYLRAADLAGVPISDLQPTLTVVSGGGSVASTIVSLDSVYPGYWRARLQLGPQGATTFRVEFGPISKEVTVRSGG